VPITPDTKDWTWVLERPCPECGFDATGLSGEHVVELLRENVAAWPSVLARPDVADRPSDDRWSPLEYACHVRDVFRLYDQRLGWMLTQDDPHFPNWDQDETAVAERYGAQDPGVVADELAVAGEQLARSFEAVTGDQWARTGQRSDGASFTVETFAVYLVHDPIHHLWDVG
jgi:DinB superfamily